MTFLLIGLSGVLLLFLAFFRNRPTIEIFLQAGFWIMRKNCKVALEICNILHMWKLIVRFIKFIFWILAEISKIYEFSRKHEICLKIDYVIYHLKKRNRNFYKNRSRRSENLKFKTKIDYLTPTGIPTKPDEENVEKGRSGKQGKTIFLLR